MAGIFSNLKDLISRIAGRKKAFEPNSPEMRHALTRIGNTVVNRTVANIVSKRIVDQGALMNSITYKLAPDRVTIGSYGVRYARFHEFGAELHPGAVRAMFAAIRGRSGPRRPSKGVLEFRPDGSAKLKARPFLRPAFESERPRIEAIVREFAKGRR
jgi:HK97 gp10 family phage protein